MSKTYEHTPDETGVCTKCHHHSQFWNTTICPVIGKEEVANFSLDGEDL